MDVDLGLFHSDGICFLFAVNESQVHQATLVILFILFSSSKSVVHVRFSQFVRTFPKLSCYICRNIIYIITIFPCTRASSFSLSLIVVNKNFYFLPITKIRALVGSTFSKNSTLDFNGCIRFKALLSPNN